MNRKDRRRMAKENKPRKPPSFHRLTREQRMEKIEQNGITIRDLKENYDIGYRTALDEIATFSQKFFYAGAALACRRHLRFGKKRIIRFLENMRNAMLDDFTTIDIIKRCFDETGIDIEILDRIEKEVV